MQSQAETVVRDLVLERPAALRVLDRYHIDYCCGGGLPLGDACAQAGTALDVVLRAIDEEEARDEGAHAERDWSAVDCDALIDHIVETHHAYTRRELERLRPLMGKVAGHHGPAHPELMRVAEIFAALDAELEPHMRREERLLFPYIRRLQAGTRAPNGPIQRLDGPLAVMSAEHDQVGALLRELRETTVGFALPEGACGSYRALFAGLEALEGDIHRHVHLENNVLFPKARGLEGGVEA